MLEATLAGSVDQKLRSMARLIYKTGEVQIGYEEKRSKADKPYKTSRRHRQIAGMRSDLRKLKAQHQRAPIDQMEPLEELKIELREKLKSLRKTRRGPFI